MEKKNHRKSKATPESIKEAEKLRELWEKRVPKISQAEFGSTYGIGTQPAVGFFLSGVNPLSMKAAKGFAAGLKCGIAEFSPRWAKVAAEISPYAPKSKTGPLSFLDLNRVEAQLVGLYRELSPEKQTALMKTATKFHTTEKETQK